MEQLEADSIKLELKYCERCGGLGLRPERFRSVVLRRMCKGDRGHCAGFKVRNRTRPWTDVQRRSAALLAILD